MVLRSLAALSTVAWLALPGAALAEDYCVAPKDSCGPGNLPTLEDALRAAASEPNADRIYLGSATYEASLAGHGYAAPDAPVELIGAGRDATTLTVPDGGRHVLYMDAGPGSLVRDLSIELPAMAREPASGLVLWDQARRVHISARSPQSELLTGVEMRDDASLVDSVVAMGNMSHGQIAVEMGYTAAGARVERSRLAADTGVTITARDATLDRLAIEAGVGVGVYHGSAAIRSSVLRTPGTGLVVSDQGSSPRLTADGVTIFGTGPGTTGAAAFARVLGSTGSATFRLRNSIIADTERSLWRSAVDGEAHMRVEFSAFDPATMREEGPGAMTPGAGSLEPGSNLDLDPLFAAPPGNLRLGVESPLIDAGDPGAAEGNDFDGIPLVLDGDGDGVSRRDMGAHEWQPTEGSATRPGWLPAASLAPARQPDGTRARSRDTRAPRVARLRMDPRRFRPMAPHRGGGGRGTRVSWRMDEAGVVNIAVRRSTRASCPRRCSRTVVLSRLTKAGRVGGNALRYAGRSRGRRLSAGRYRATLRAIDAAGNRSRPSSVAFTIVG